MKEVIRYVPEIEGDVERNTMLGERPFKKGDSVATKEEALEIEIMYKANLIQEAFYKRYREVLLALAKVSTIETVDDWIDKIFLVLQPGGAK